MVNEISRDTSIVEARAALPLDGGVKCQDKEVKIWVEEDVVGEVPHRTMIGRGQ